MSCWVRGRPPLSDASVVLRLGESMNCEGYEDLLAAHVDGVLTPAERQQVGSHLRWCSRCRQLTMRARRFRVAFAARHVVLPVPVEVEHKLRDALALAGETEPMRKAPSRKRQHRLKLLIALAALVGCSTLAQRRWQSAVDQSERIFAPCAERCQRGEFSGWTAEVRCGTDGARPPLAGNTARSVELATVALEYRLQVARQIATGTLPEKEGRDRLAAMNRYIRALPGSFDVLLSGVTTAAANS